MKFTFVTLFENLIKPYFEDSILKRAILKNCFEIEFINPRNFSLNKHKKVDDYAVSGGAGLVLSPQPMFDCLSTITHENSYFIFLAPAGKQFKQKDAIRLSKKKNIIFVCGRYDGIDERVTEKFADEIFSIGDFVLTGGELAATTICDSICRNIYGVLGNSDSLSGESFENELLESPTFSKPYTFNKLTAPSIFLKGNHSKIATFKKDLALMKTKFHRPDLHKQQGTT